MRNSQHIKIKKNLTYYYEIQTHRFSEGLDIALEDLVWIFLQNILEEVRRKTAAQIHSFIYVDQKIYIIASFTEARENYFKSLLCEKLNAEDDLLPAELIADLKTYYDQTAEMFLQPEKQGRSYQNYPYSSLKYLLNGFKSFVQIEDHLNLTYDAQSFLRFMDNKKKQIVKNAFSSSFPLRYNFSTESGGV